jgi:hypothetical protein
MGKINKEWHMKNKMLKNASEEQRIRWHLEHSKNCSCRPIPLKVLELMEKKGIKAS